ncbi:head-tail connector protein [Rhizobium sp. Rhizsp82]|uniref:head-tail connector protein n=1 Tax=Rhizobium sp. Rhizsp82 TaxID=3243057 RepID=UPI0039B5F265
MADVKAELRILHAHEDGLIQRKLSAAIDYVESAIGKKLADIEGGAPASLDEAIIALACHLYEHRGVATESALSAIPSGFQDMIRTSRYGRFADADT